jgi:sugar phosphate isomerase/epimerase
MSKLAINEVTTYRWSLLQDVIGSREAAIDAIGVWRPKLAEFGEERGIDLILDSGLSVSSLSWAGGFTGSHGQSFDEAVEDARDAIRVAGRLGARSLVVFSGSRSGHTGNHARRLLVDALRSLADFAAAHDLCLAVQPMHPRFASEWTFLTSIDETLEVLSACDHRHLRMSFDVYHLWKEPRLLERIGEIAPFVGTVRLNDWREPPRSENDRCQLGDGEIPLSEITRAFVDAEYDGYYEIEIWSEELWSSDYFELLRRCRQRFDELRSG